MTEKVAYTGGMNLADEYINARVRFGVLEGCGNPSDRRMCLEFYKHVLGTVGLYFENRK